MKFLPNCLIINRKAFKEIPLSTIYNMHFVFIKNEDGTVEIYKNFYNGERGTVSKYFFELFLQDLIKNYKG